MFTRGQKRRAFLIVMNGFMDRYCPEIEGPGMTDQRLAERIAERMSMRLIWAAPARFSGSCDPKNLKIFAGPCPLSQSPVPVLAGAALIKMARAKYEILDPASDQLTLL
jgi:hypothetical protein